MQLTNNEIDRQAAEWLAKRDAGTLSSDEEADFQAWLAADVRALGAYCRCEGALAQVEFAAGIAESELAVFRAAKDIQGAKGWAWTRRRAVLTGGAAAGLAAAGVVGVAHLTSSREVNFATEIGTVREVTLADDSIVTLNTNSEISVRYSDATRVVHLRRGEALFDVAKNKKRPFIVLAENTEVRAVGTSFAVSMLPKQPLQILVKEGVVELKPRIAGQFAPFRVTANTRLLIPHEDRFVASTLPTSKVRRDLAWQYGQIAFDNETLHEAAEEFARYSDIRIVVDPAVANRTVTGLFAANDPVGFAKTSAEILDLKVEVKDGEVYLSDRPEKKT